MDEYKNRRDITNDLDRAIAHVKDLGHKKFKQAATWSVADHI